MGFFERQASLRPALVLVLGLLPSVYGPGWWPWMAGALVSVLGVSLWLDAQRRAGSRLTVVVGWTLVLTLGWGWRTLPDAGPQWPFSVQGPAAGWGTVVAEAPVSRRGVVPFRLRIEAVEWGDWSGRSDAVVTVFGWNSGSSPATGSRWSWAGDLSGSGTLRWRGGVQEGWAAPWWRWRAGFRSGLSAHLEPLGPAPAALGEALLLGATDDLTPWEKDSFRQAGASHVLALSGMHLSLLALLLTAMLHRRAPPAAVFVAVQLVLGVFCFLAGPIPSLLRAWVMAALGGWWALSRQPVPLQELLAQSFAVSVFLWPSLASTLSLQLSFLAMAGLFWWSQPWDRALRPWVGRWTAAQLGASAAALAATIPLTLTLFGEVRWIGLVLTPPLVFLTTVQLFGAAAVGVLALLPGFPTAVLALPFQTLYDWTFACTAWGSRFPPLGFGPVAVVAGALALGGLGRRAWMLYTATHRRPPLPVSLNYDSPTALQEFLDSQGYNALKRWGQNFLINAGARKQILAALELKPGEPVWEVGPGLGALTHHLVAQGHPLTVFEIDPGYVGFLREEFGAAPAGFQVIEGDVVKTWKQAAAPGPTGVKTVGNLPYNAASAIVADFIEGGFFPEVFVVTVQLEMAQRMTAVPGTKNHSSFSVLCQSVFRVDDVVTLKPGSFYPAPEVTSRVVRLRPHGRYPGLDHARFSRFVRECFSSRRKTLRNNLPGAASALRVADDVLTQAFAAAGVDLGLRAETLSVDQFVRIFQALPTPSA